MDTPANQGKLTRAAYIRPIFHLIWLINVAKLYMYLPAYLPGVSIQVCRVCMLNMNARYLMVTHLQGLPGRSVFR